MSTSVIDSIVFWYPCDFSDRRILISIPHSQVLLAASIIFGLLVSLVDRHVRCAYIIVPTIAFLVNLFYNYSNLSSARESYTSLGNGSLYSLHVQRECDQSR